MKRRNFIKALGLSTLAIVANPKIIWDLKRIPTLAEARRLAIERYFKQIEYYALFGKELI